MRLAHISDEQSPNPEVLRRVERIILAGAAAVALAALVAHHAGLSALIALLAALVVTLLERLRVLPLAGATEVSRTTGKFGYADGGSFNAAELEKRADKGKSVIVIDGGSSK